MIHLSSETGELFTQAFSFAQKQIRKLIEKHPGFYPLYTRNGSWKHEGPAWTHWCDGFLPGMMWIFCKHAQSDSADGKFWMEQAIKYSKSLEPRKNDRDVHDLGFLFLSTYYRWYRLTKEPALREVLMMPRGGHRLAPSSERLSSLKAFASACRRRSTKPHRITGAIWGQSKRSRRCRATPSPFRNSSRVRPRSPAASR